MKTNKPVVNSTGGYIGFIIATIAIIIFFWFIISVQQTNILDDHIAKELKAESKVSYEHIGGEEHIKFYKANVNNEDFIIRVNQAQLVIDSYNLNERPEVGEFFKQKYDINL